MKRDTIVLGIVLAACGGASYVYSKYKDGFRNKTHELQSSFEEKEEDFSSSQEKVTLLRMEKIKSSLGLYKSQFGDYPQKLQDLKSFFASEPHFFMDGYGNVFVYKYKKSLLGSSYTLERKNNE